VVGIGASAGGLDALERFFDALPADTGMAFVVIQHLSPAFKSLMDQLLQRHTELPIHLVEDGMRVEPNHVYLIPPKKEMIISDDRLLLSEREQNQELTLPIDVFFRSLARDCGERAIGIVLSGGGSDGSRGIRDIHEAGGLVIVQDGASAQFDGMPRTARDAGVAHWVLAPAEMPGVLLRYAAGRTGSEPPALDAGQPEGIDAVYRMLQDEYGIDFTSYKPSTITRRIDRRLSLARSQNIQEYVRHLREDKLELDVLYRDLLIGVTRFFRDEAAFRVLQETVLPELLERVPRDRPLRVWVTGCATGEEVYSLAIVLSDLMLERGPRIVKIFATDVHKGSLERAARGVYDEEAVQNVSPERLARYFLRIGSTYQVVPELRQMVVYAPHNVIRDAPFTRVDLITCRNLLIYLQPAAQQKVLSLCHFALNRGGVLFLGPSENIGPLARDLETVDKHWKIYRKLSDARAAQVPRPSPSQNPPASEARPMLDVHQAPASRYSLSQLLATYDALLDEVMPPSLLVSDRGEMIHTFNGASRFLRFRDGRPGLEVFDCVDAELKMVLIGGLKRALQERAPVVFKGVRLESDGASALYKVTIRSVQRRNIGTPHLLISFEPMEIVDSPQNTETEIRMDQVSREQLALLEVELSHAKQNLQAAVEELETSNEELQASNEELQASNEELQSTNEELQSVNEELYTVNTEYQRKIGELTELANDMDNLLGSTDVGAIFLDSELRIRKFTAQVAGAFSLVAHDVGRSIETFAHKMEHPELVGELKHVLATGERIERELRDAGGKVLFLRILPYRAKGQIDGVVLTLIDMSGLRAAEDALFHERYLLNSLLRGVPDAIYFKDARGRFIRMNDRMVERLGFQDAEQAVGKMVFELPDQKRALLLHQGDEAVLQTGEAQLYSEEMRLDADGTEQWDLVSRLPLRDAKDGVVGVIAIFRSITEQKRADEKIQEAVRRRDQFLAMLSHELRNPLGAIATASALLRTDGAVVAQPKLLEVVDRQTQQMGRLLDDLLEVTRVTENKIELRKRVVDLRGVLSEAADAVSAVMSGRGLSFSIETAPEPLYVEGDPTRLQQIHVNLLSNAAKYTPTGGHVVLSAECQEDAAVIRVRDDGVGIAKDMLDSVFELFVQSARTLDRAAGGLGVGLTLARSLVSMHGGTISAASDGEGRGSEFVVRLPLASGPPSERPAARSLPKLAGQAKVLIVEDNDDSRELLHQLLERAGFGCKTAGTGTAALEVLRGFAPDIAILDVGLPEMDGFELARRIRQDPEHAHTILIAVTGYGRAADHAASREVGFDGHLVKPVNTGQLLALLASITNDNGASSEFSAM